MNTLTRELPPLKWKRTEKGRRASACGRFTFHLERARRWSLYIDGRWVDGATWSQVFETARQRLAKEQKDAPASSSRGS